jgi:VWFA-related protein
MLRPCVRLWLCLSLIGVDAAVPAARQPQQPRPQFRTGVELIEVDVSVLDRDRTPVRGLTASDFTILEEGRRQQIVSFSAIEVPEPEATRTAWMRDVAPDVSANVGSSDRLVVLVLDDAQVQMELRNIRAVKTTARAVIDRLGPSDLGAVLFTRDQRGAQAFTTDRARLRAAIDSFTPGHTETPRLSHIPTRADWSLEYFFRSTLETLHLVAEALADARQRRKAVVYVSPGVPLGGAEMDAYTRRRLASALFREARRANANFYAVDPSGLVALEGEDPGANPPSPEAGPARQSRAYDFLYALASETGGLAIVNRNDFAASVNQIFTENALYYLLGYQSTSAMSKREFRKIEVKVNRPDVTVRARTGYYRAKPEAPPGAEASSPSLVKALTDVAPKGDVTMQVSAAPFAVPGRKKASVAFVLAFRQPKQPMPGQGTERVDVLVGAYGSEGQHYASQKLEADIVFRPADEDYIRYELLSELPLAPGRYQLRFAAESALQGKSGSVHYDVEVPDFSKGDLALSGVVLSVSPNDAAAPKDRLAKLIPVVPTSRRDFWVSDRTTAFMRVYRNKAGTTPLVRARILDDGDRVVFEREEALDATRFDSSGAGDYRLELPIDTLPPGPYLLTLEAQGGNTSTRRHVRFTRR